MEGGQYEKPWIGPCPHCGRFCNGERLSADLDDEGKSKFLTSSSFVKDIVHIPTGIDFFDGPMGGGLVAGSLVLLGGEEGAGKTSLSHMIANSLAKTRDVLYINSEQPAEELVLIQRRLGIENDRVKLLGNTSNVHAAIEACRLVKPVLAVFDSVSMMNTDDADHVGGRTQGEQVLNIIRKHCKNTNMIGSAVNQLGADGFFKGSTMLRYMVDTLVYADKIFSTEADWEKRRKSQLRGIAGYENARSFQEAKGLRQLISGKNRNAPESQKAYFEITKEGLLAGVEKHDASLIERI
jgi:DNA repair protein RadA/Sms